MEKGNYRKYRFSAISIKRDVAIRFRAFSRLVSGSHTQTLETVMNFFEWNDLSPNDDLGIRNNRTNKRINAVIAILKNIEKHQTLPTKTMMDTLFHELSEMEMEERESVDFGAPKLLESNEDLGFYKKRYEEVRQQLVVVQKGVESLLEKVVHIKGTFGPGHFRLDMDKESFEKLKNELQDVHNHYRTEN